MIYAVIMAGGKGTRFWPLSRKLRAKQYLNIVGKKSLLEQTILRLQPYISKQNTWIVGSVAQQRFLKASRAGVPIQNILFEPLGRNTAPCIGWATVELLKRDPDAVMVVLPADHIIKPAAELRRILKCAVACVKQHDGIVTIGIKPTSPHTGYGYIESQKPGQVVSEVKTFREKPDLKQAQQFIKTGRFYWNAGMFVFKAKTMMRLFEKHLPEQYKLLLQIQALKSKGRQYQQRLSELYAKMTSISIDYGIMEHLTQGQGFVVRADFEWSDIGSWTALVDYWHQDQNKNSINGRVLALDSSKNIVYSKKRLVALVDVHDLIVVDADDALLIIPKKSDQKIKALYDQLPMPYQ